MPCAIDHDWAKRSNMNLVKNIRKRWDGLEAVPGNGFPMRVKGCGSPGESTLVGLGGKPFDYQYLTRPTSTWMKPDFG
jgi:hypothetical protein